MREKSQHITSNQQLISVSFSIRLKLNQSRHTHRLLCLALSFWQIVVEPGKKKFRIFIFIQLLFSQTLYSLCLFRIFLSVGVFSSTCFLGWYSIYWAERIKCAIRHGLAATELHTICLRKPTNRPNEKREQEKEKKSKKKKQREFTAQLNAKRTNLIQIVQ